MNPRQLEMAILRLYTSLPDTPDRPRPYDRKIARELAQQRLSYPLLKATFLLATARRLLRDPDLSPLSPIRSLASSGPRSISVFTLCRARVRPPSSSTPTLTLVPPKSTPTKNGPRASEREMISKGSDMVGEEGRGGGNTLCVAQGVSIRSPRKLGNRSRLERSASSLSGYNQNGANLDCPRPIW